MMSSIDTIQRRAPSQRVTIGQLAKKAGKLMRVWFRAYTTRRQLHELTASELEDLNLTREAALNEARRPFWETAHTFLQRN